MLPGRICRYINCAGNKDSDTYRLKHCTREEAKFNPRADAIQNQQSMGLTMSLWFAVFARMRKSLWLDFPMEGARGLFIRHRTGSDELERHGRLGACPGITRERS